MHDQINDRIIAEQKYEQFCILRSLLALKLIIYVNSNATV